MEKSKVGGADGKPCRTNNDNQPPGRLSEPGPSIVSRSTSAAEKAIEAAFHRALLRRGRDKDRG